MRRPLKAMSRIRRQGNGNVTLFPFLAVLICTMGALILLLVVIAQQARVQAAQATAADDVELAQRKKELETAEQSIAWQMEQVKIARQKTESQMADARLELGHLEDHANRLARELVRLEATWKELDSLEADGSRQRADLEAELEQLEARIARARKLLAEARENADFKRKSYAVIPYEGPNGTRRRPIYIECRADAVVLQPEGIALGDADFAGPLGPGNPLDVALRAVAEYLTRQHAWEAPIEPYPLLLVRPDGIEAYYAARAAMKSWGSDFGYELIGDDWNLQFDSRDPALIQEITQAVATARARQQFLIAAAPGRYGGSSRPTYVARPYRGGVVRADGAGEDGARTATDRRTGRFGQPSNSTGTGHPGQVPDRNGTVSGRPSGEVDPSSSGTVVAMRPGEWTPKPERGTPRSSENPQSGETAPELAATRGRDWALPGASGGSTPITRPIRIFCHRDRLELAPESGMSGSQIVALSARTEETIDTFVSAVWDHMDSWGIAGNGMYWRPILNVRVAPGADRRYADLKSLLEGSGLTVRRVEH